MERSEVKFRARDQVLTFTGGIRRYASDTVNYVEAYFELQDNWSGFDVIAAVWNNGSARIATDLDSDGKCRVPQEVLSKKGDVYVNLTGTTSVGNAVTERLTSYPVWVLAVDAKSHIRGTETAEITPSQFEQFASNVRADADRAEAGATASEASALEASASAGKAEQAAGQSGYMFFHIDERGHLIYERTTNVEVDFYLQGGHLYVEGIA